MSEKHNVDDPKAVVSVRHYFQGGHARKSGSEAEANPYPADSWEAFSWLCGWLDEQ